MPGSLADVFDEFAAKKNIENHYSGQLDWESRLDSTVDLHPSCEPPVIPNSRS